jgi:hypothetical protein
MSMANEKMLPALQMLKEVFFEVQASIIQLIIIKVYSRRKILRGTSGFH